MILLMCSGLRPFAQVLGMHRQWHLMHAQVTLVLDHATQMYALEYGLHIRCDTLGHRSSAFAALAVWVYLGP